MVIVHPVTAAALVPGDWVFVRGVQGAFLHRYLGWRKGHIVTKGDAHRAFDPTWPPDAILGRVVEAQREGRCFYCRTPGQLRCERLLAAGHHVLGDVWGVLRRVKALLLAVYVVAFSASIVWAAVTLTSFTAEVGTDSIILWWETASETNNLGFRLWRSQVTGGSYVDISGFIASLDEGAGAVYQYEDIAVMPGVIYYYKLQDVPDDGSTGDYTTPISATIRLNGTATPTLTPTPTMMPTSTPNPYVRFWADKTDLIAGECATLYWQTQDVLAVHLDGLGVSGDSQRRFCPCVTERHILRVQYLNGTTEDFEITLNVTGECAIPTETATPTPRATLFTDATATPYPTATPASTLPLLDLTATVSMAEQQATATVSAEMQPAMQNAAQAMPQPANPLVSPLAPLTASSEIEILAEPVTTTSSLLPTRVPVEGKSSGLPVEDLLSVWLLIVGGIAAAGFIGAGILMWKRQQ